MAIFNNLRQGLVVLWLLALVTRLCSAPTISEFQADNADTIRDEDGQNSDWIEIHNPDTSAVNLAGMSLTDDPLVPRKWIFPSISVPADGYLLVWASGKNRATPPQPLHTNFALQARGGYLAFFAADGTTKLAEFANYPDQPEDRSYGTSEKVAEPVTYIAPGASCRWRVPTAEIPNWQARTFVDTSWTLAATGIGYDDTATPVNYVPLLGAGGNTRSAMFNINGTVFIRVPFTVASASAVQSLTLKMRFDDGFAAYLNGTRLNPPSAADGNAPASLPFNARAPAARADASAVVAVSWDISAQRNLLVDGVNILAIHGLNATVGSSDLLILPELLGTVTSASGATTIGYLVKPSPGQPNIGKTGAGFVDAPDFSVKRGFFTSTQLVSLTSKTPGAQIRYTTNGTPPTDTTGTLYDGSPVSIANSAVLRAIAFRTGWHSSTVKSHTYIFPTQVVNQPASIPGYPTNWGRIYDFSTGGLHPTLLVPADYRMDPGVTTHPAYQPQMQSALTTTLPVMAIGSEIGAIFNPSTGIYCDARITDGLEIPVSVEYFDPNDTTGRAKWQENAGLRIHGGHAPLEHPKKPFRIYFRKDYGVGKLRYPLYPGSPVEEFDTLQLRPGGHDGWSVPFGSTDQDLAFHATYLRNRFCHETELALGRLSPRGRFVHLYINGLYWGIYDLHEVPSREFFKDHVGGTEADWDVVQNPRFTNESFGMIDGDAAAMNTLLSLCRPPSNLVNPSVYNQVRQYIDPAAFADYLIVQMWAGQNDWMGPVFKGTGTTDASRFFNKNWEAGRLSRGTNPGTFMFVNWDAEISLGSHLSSLLSQMRNVDLDFTRVGTPISVIPRISGTPGPPAEIYYAMRQNPNFRLTLADRLQKHFFNGGALEISANQARLDALSSQLTLPIIAESARWGDVNSGRPIVVTFTRNDHWQPEIDWLRDTFIPQRNSIVIDQFKQIRVWPETKAPVYSKYGGVVPTGFVLNITNPNSDGGVIYYTLNGEDPAAPMTVEKRLLVDANTPSQYKVPTAQYSSNHWKNAAPPADIATWQTGTSALGYDTDASLAQHFTTTVVGMHNVNPSLYVRIPFTLTSSEHARIDNLTLRLKYNDGAFVFVNGSVPLQRLNAPLTTPSFNSTATASRTDAASGTFSSFDLTSLAPLQPGQNLLALQGLNVSAASPDFLLSAELEASLVSPGQPSAGAMVLSGPLILEQNVQVKARVLRDGQWSPLIDASFLVGVPANEHNLTITEINYNPRLTAAERSAGLTSQQFEFIELQNISSTFINLRGLRFTTGIHFDFNTLSNQQLGPGQRLILAADPTALQLRIPGLPIDGTFADSTNLANNGERLTLLAADGSAIANFVYDDAYPWPTTPDGQGFSLVLINPFSDPDLANPRNWRSSVLVDNAGASDADTFAAYSLRNSQAPLPNEDANHNGLTNYVEYGLGLTPESAGLGFSADVRDIGGQDFLILSYLWNRAAEDVDVIPEFSSNLADWQPLVDTATAPRDLGGGIEAWEVRTPLPFNLTQRIFCRITVRSRP